MKVVIALPGRTFSGTFLMNWTQTVMTLSRKGYEVVVTNEYSSYVTYSRMKTLGLDVLRGSDQVPFGGTLNYDVWLTIDSDIIFTPEQVIELIEDTKKYPVVSGLYRMQDRVHFAAVQEWNVEYFKKYGSFEFMRDLPADKYVPVAYNGMGFFACRRGVIEKLKYPYFSYPLVEIEAEDGKILRDTCSEDVSFCKNLTDAGFEIMVNTGLHVGHEKTVVL
jgi:sugar phosphate isomerase/epimerase